MMTKLNEWICTDSDCSQYLRWLGDTKYELLEIRYMVGPYGVFHAVIDVLSEMENDREAVKSCLKMFYQDGLQEVLGEYQEDANQIIAECIFEMNYHEVLRSGSIDDCKEFITQYIQ